MDEMNHELNQSLEIARHIAQEIEDGMKTEYWKLIEKKVKGWIRGEQKHLDLLNSRILNTKEDIDERNDSVKKLSMLKQFLNINETMIGENLNIISSLKPEVENSYKRVNSFVGNNGNKQ